MNITGLLLKPDLNNLKNDFLNHLNELESREYSSELAKEAGAFLRHGLQEIEQLISALSHGSLREDANPGDLYATFRRLKLGLHFVRRKLRRFISTRARIQKIQERRSHVAAFVSGTVHSNPF